MATPEVQIEQNFHSLSFIAGEALTGHKYKPVYLSAERKVKLMTANDLSQKFIGFNQTGDISGDTTVATDSHVSVMIEGVTKAVAAGAFSVGDFLTVSDSQGRLDTASDNEVVVAMALEAASVINHEVTVLIIRSPIKGDNTA